jgi:hypothetical protein
MIRKSVKIIHEGQYAAEVPVELIEEEGGWSPYLSLEDANKLDAVRKALREGDVATASKHGRIFELHPVSAE